ncbi:MAG: GNAT family N-acetyltransferase [Sneathiellaceae bacterium]
MTGGEGDMTVAGPADAAVLAAIHAAAFGTGWGAGEIEDLLRLETVLGLVLCAEGQPAGFVLVSLVAGEAEILTLAVPRERRRQGLGRRLLAAALRLSAARGATRMVLEVSEANAAARALYDAAGFSPVGRRRGYYRGACGAEDALVLARHLSGGTNEASD